MHAVFKISGFQFAANVGDIIQIPLQKAKQGDKIDITEILMIKDKKNTLIGT
ncbi:MAG: bL21 family ribosomal protein, partial [Candidatus Zixiibacteriota bacterium]